MINNKKGQGNILFWIVGIALVAFILNIGDIRTGKGLGTTITPEPGITPAQICSDPSNTLTYGPIDERYVPGTTMTGERIQAYVNGVDQGKVSSGATKTVAPGDKIKLVYGMNSTIYLNSVVEFEAPCGAVDSSSVDSNRYQLVRWDSAPTINAFNSDDGNLNSLDANETIGLGATGKWDIRILGTAKRNLNNEEGYTVFVVGINKTAFKEGEVTLTGEGLEATSVPGAWTARYNEETAIAFKKKFAVDATGNPVDFRMTLQVPAEASVNPNETPATSFVNLTIYPAVWFKNTVTGAIEGPAVTDNTNDLSFNIDGTGLSISRALHYD